MSISSDRTPVHQIRKSSKIVRKRSPDTPEPIPRSAGFLKCFGFFGIFFSMSKYLVAFSKFPLVIDELKSKNVVNKSLLKSKNDSTKNLNLIRKVITDSKVKDFVPLYRFLFDNVDWLNFPIFDFSE